MRSLTGGCTMPPMSSSTHPFNKQVGAKVRGRRLLLGMSQRQLGDAIGLTYQQIQKYENGTNRIDASRLAALGEALDVQPEWFFTNLEEGPQVVGPAADDEFAGRELLKLVRAFSRIRNATKRECLVELTQSIGDAEEVEQTS